MICPQNYETIIKLRFLGNTIEDIAQQINCKKDEILWIETTADFQTFRSKFYEGYAYAQGALFAQEIQLAKKQKLSNQQESALKMETV